MQRHQQHGSTNLFRKNERLKIGSTGFCNTPLLLPAQCIDDPAVRGRAHTVCVRVVVMSPATAATLPRRMTLFRVCPFWGSPSPFEPTDPRKSSVGFWGQYNLFLLTSPQQSHCVISVSHHYVCKQPQIRDRHQRCIGILGTRSIAGVAHEITSSATATCMWVVRWGLFYLMICFVHCYC